MEGGEVPEKVKRANVVRYLKKGKMVKIERRSRRKMLEDPGLRAPAPPPSSRGTPYGASEVTAGSRLAITEALRNRQDKISGATAALCVAGEEPGARASSGECLQQQGPPGRRASCSGGPSSEEARRRRHREQELPAMRASSNKGHREWEIPAAGTPMSEGARRRRRREQDRERFRICRYQTPDSRL